MLANLKNKSLFSVTIKLLTICFGLYLVYYVSDILYNYYNTNNFHFNLSWISVILSICFYFSAHIFRVIRLIILAEDPQISIRKLFLEQLKANGVNLLLPFRLGEAYRVVAFKQFFGTNYKSFVFLLVERIFDFSTILILFYIAQEISNKEHHALAYIHYFSIFLIIFIVCFFFVFEEMLSIFHRLLIARYTSKTGLFLTKFTSHLLQAIINIKSILSRRLVTCLSFTVIIWAFEIASFSMFLPVLDNQIDALLFLATLSFLASLLPSGPMGYGGIQLAFYMVAILWNNTDLVGYSIYYNLFIFLPAIVLTGLLFLQKNKVQS